MPYIAFYTSIMISSCCSVPITWHAHQCLQSLCKVGVPRKLVRLHHIHEYLHHMQDILCSSNGPSSTVVGDETLCELPSITLTSCLSTKHLCIPFIYQVFYRSGCIYGVLFMLTRGYL